MLRSPVVAPVPPTRSPIRALSPEEIACRSLAVFFLVYLLLRNARLAKTQADRVKIAKRLQAVLQETGNLENTLAEIYGILMAHCAALGRETGISLGEASADA